jgi:site-specific recombinase XerD
VLNPHVEAYVVYLSERGYAPRTIDMYLRSVAHFAHWSASRLRVLEVIHESLVQCYIDEHLPVCRCAPRCVRTKVEARAALVHLLALLRSEGLVAERASRVPAAIAAELHAFDDYLAEVRGLRAVTRQQGRLKHVRDFLLVHFADDAVEVATLIPHDIERFVRRRTAGWKPSSVKQVCIALRSYFRFKATQGVDTVRLAGAVPHVAQWRLSSLPRSLSGAEVKQLLDAFDRSAATGRRDYAIARCYVDLGLRTAEVVRLQLEDLDWREGRIYIRSKGRRTDVLPLPRATGSAIAAYLCSGRRRTASRALFLRHRPPLDKPATADTIRGAMRNVALRCGLADRLTGTHILRHTVARRLVQSGASLKSIADLLRHRNLDTTTIYAKVDLDALSGVAAPWPGRRA